MSQPSDAVPRGDAEGFRRYLKQDLLAGFLVFLIALPLCLGIALASGCPAIAGVFTAIVGAVVATFVSNSELTIKGPAAGLIVVVMGCVAQFGGDGANGGFHAADVLAYRSALAVGVAAAVLQILFGLVRGGGLGEFFPLSAVHGMLAAIGVIIIVKQVPVALGYQDAGGEPLEMIGEIPHYFAEMNPAIALLGGVGVVIMFAWPWLQKAHRALKAIPSPLVVLLATVPLGIYMDLGHAHTYRYAGEAYTVSDDYLIKMPDRVFGMFDFATFPEFSALAKPFAWKWVAMFFIIGSLESVLSAKAIDLLDPWRRRSSMDRDLVAVGVGNVCASMIGGLPMISEIVRSRANIDSGARTRFANLWHGVFLLVCVALLPMYLHLIPKAALAAMLVYTGFRLAHPSEFRHMLQIGTEQLTIFVTTLVAVLATDLLIGIGIGILAKLVIHVINGAPMGSIFRPYLAAEQIDESTVRVSAQKSAIFSNWILFRRQVVQAGLQQRMNVDLDLSQTRLVDHTVMGKLQELQHDFKAHGLVLNIMGLENHRPLSSHPSASRKRA